MLDEIVAHLRARGRRAGLFLQRHRRHRRRPGARRPARPSRGGLHAGLRAARWSRGWAPTSTWWAPTWSRWRRRWARPRTARRTVELGARYLARRLEAHARIASPHERLDPARADDHDDDARPWHATTASWSTPGRGLGEAGGGDRTARRGEGLAREVPGRPGDPAPARGLRQGRGRRRPRPWSCWRRAGELDPDGPSRSCARPRCWPPRASWRRRWRTPTAAEEQGRGGGRAAGGHRPQGRPGAGARASPAARQDAGGAARPGRCRPTAETCCAELAHLFLAVDDARDRRAPGSSGPIALDDQDADAWHGLGLAAEARR